MPEYDILDIEHPACQVVLVLGKKLERCLTAITPSLVGKPTLLQLLQEHQNKGTFSDIEGIHGARRVRNRIMHRKDDEPPVTLAEVRRAEASFEIALQELLSQPLLSEALKRLIRNTPVRGNTKPEDSRTEDPKESLPPQQNLESASSSPTRPSEESPVPPPSQNPESASSPPTRPSEECPPPPAPPRSSRRITWPSLAVVLIFVVAAGIVAFFVNRGHLEPLATSATNPNRDGASATKVSPPQVPAPIGDFHDQLPANEPRISNPRNVLSSSSAVTNASEGAASKNEEFKRLINTNLSLSRTMPNVGVLVDAPGHENVSPLVESLQGFLAADFNQAHLIMNPANTAGLKAGGFLEDLYNGDASRLGELMRLSHLDHLLIAKATYSFRRQGGLDPDLLTCDLTVAAQLVDGRGTIVQSGAFSALGPGFTEKQAIERAVEDAARQISDKLLARVIP